MRTNRSKRKLSLLMLAVGLAFTPRSFAQEPVPSAGQPQQGVIQQAPVSQDPLESLRLTPDQRQQIRAIREANKDERNSVVRRLRQAQNALEDALDSDNPSEALIEERVREVGEAQVAVARLRALQELRIRRVLTPEQQATLRQIHIDIKKIQDLKQQQQRIENQMKQRRNGNLPKQGNGIAPQPGAGRNNLLRKRP